jgi:hypothetical protein
MVHRRSALLNVAVAFLSATALVAHHGSNVSYQIDKTVTITGTVTEWEFVNPHPQIYFDVTRIRIRSSKWKMSP